MQTMHTCRTCGQPVNTSSRGHAEALEECPNCEERRYNADRAKVTLTVTYCATCAGESTGCCCLAHHRCALGLHDWTF